MKKIYIILFLILSACSLDVPIGDKIPVDNFYKTKADFELALNGAYDMLGTHQDNSGYGTYFRGLMIMGRAGTDEGYINQDFQPWATEISNYTFTSLSIIPDRVWAAQYKGIARCNAILNKIDNAVGNWTEAERDQEDRIKGEAHFLRAFYYFQLVRFYGAVPIYLGDIQDVSQLSSVDLSNRDIEDVYGQIISDFNKAEELLPIENENGRARKYAAAAFLSKVYLQMAGYPLRGINPILADSSIDKAEECAKRVMDKSGWGLLPNYADVFSSENEYSREHIFSVEYTFCGNCEGGQVGTFDGVPGGRYYYSTFRTFQEMSSSYLVGDARKDQNIARYNLSSDGVRTEVSPTHPYYYAFKFRHPIKASDRPSGFFEWQSPINFPLLRYSDILLTYAEARALKTGASYNGDGSTSDSEALRVINLVRNRAGFSVNSNLQSIKMSDILEERKLELCFEGHRWHDLVRHGKLIDKVKQKQSGDVDGINYVVGSSVNVIRLATAGINIKPHHVFFPIPQSQIQISNGKLKQNVGY